MYHDDLTICCTDLDSVEERGLLNDGRWVKPVRFSPWSLSAYYVHGTNKGKTVNIQGWY